jgi:hypothetical protein
MYRSPRTILQSSPHQFLLRTIRPFGTTTTAMASSSHTYKIATNPTVAAQQPRAAALVSFFETFYATSDDPAAHEKYARSFTANATLVMGGKGAKGYDGMLYTFFKIC